MTEGAGFGATVILLTLCNAFILAVASPVYMPQFLPGGTGRNIRHLPCVSRRTKETGVCMFAFTCVKANGTHLGTCIDRFYFGSCCKLDGEPDIFHNENTIDHGPPKPFITHQGPVESNNIPEYVPKPTTITTKPPIKTTDAPAKTTKTPVTLQKPVKTTERPLPSTSRAPVLKPVKVTLNSTNKNTTSPLTDSTTESVSLSTFQTVQVNPSKTSTARPTPAVTSKPPVRISTTSPVTTTSKPRPPVNKPTSTVKPNQKPSTQNVTKVEVKPVNKPPVNKPSSVKPINTGQGSATTANRTRVTTPKPTSSNTAKPILTPTPRPTSATRFPPRNATTTTTTTLRPTRPTRPPPVRRPTPTTTKKPTSSPIKRITTTTTTPATPVNQRPVTSGGVGSRPSTASGIKNITQAGESVPTKRPTTPSIPYGGYKPVLTAQRPSVTGNKTAITSATVGIKQTTKQPSTPSNEPMATPATPVATTSKPLVTRPKPVTIHETPTTRAPAKRPTTNPTTITTPQTTTTSTTTTTTTAAPVTKQPTTSASRPSTPSSTTLSLNSSTISNEVISIDDTANGVDSFDTSKVESTSYSPGLVTWTSNSDDATTRSPVVATSTLEPEDLESTNTEWTPITTPDGWILIQSPGPNEDEKYEENQTVKPSSKPTTEQTPVSDKPITVSRPTTETSTARPSLPTVATTSSTTDNYVPTAELNMSDYKQVCGRRLFPESRIVGGARSSFGKWPWQISLRQWRTSTYLHKCGAALLNENWAITAAHCVENVPPSDLLLRLGEHDLASEDEPYGFQERRVQIVASHPQFDPRTFEYDLALLRFYEPLLPFQPNTLPICLPDDDANYVGLTAHVTGWGRLYEDGPLPSVLQEVPVPVINNTVCEAMYRSAGYIEHIPKIFICAGWRKGGFDSCEGDSGGPLVIQRPRDKRWILAGVISWGIGCAEPNQPGVYTRISEFREWINQILQF